METNGEETPCMFKAGLDNQKRAKEALETLKVTPGPALPRGVGAGAGNLTGFKVL